MPRITISYRRGDSLDITGRIFDRLTGHFGRESVFRDIDNIPLGVDFRRHLEMIFDASDVVLAIVGPRWVGPRAGQSRLASAADPVRVEIEIVLSKDKPLIPVLVSRAVMPSPDQLPESLRDFVYRHALQVDSGQDFDVHIGRLIRAIERLSEIEETQATKKTVQSVVAVIEAAPLIDRAGNREFTPEPDIAPPVPEDAPQTEPVAEQPATLLPESSATARAPVAQRAPAIRRGGSRWITASAIAMMLAVFGAGSWWFFVGWPAEIAQHEAAAAAKARAEEQAHQTAIDRARQDQAARQAAAAADKAQQDEQARQAAAAKAAQDDLARRAAALKAQQDEQARQAAAAKADQDDLARRAAALKAQQDEQARQAAAAKAVQDEAATANTEPRVATVAPPPPPTASAPVTPPARDIARLLQTELKRVGCYGGPVDGVWGASAQSAVRQFNHRAGTELGADSASLESVAVVKDHVDRVCPVQPARRQARTEPQAVGDRDYQPFPKNIPEPTREQPCVTFNGKCE